MLPLAPIVSTDPSDLSIVIRQHIAEYGPNCDLNHIDVSQITSMIGLFSMSEFNGDVSKWDVSNVTNMDSLFAHSPFNGDVSSWNMSKVTKIRCMFQRTPFTGDVSRWDVRNVKDATAAFASSSFTGDLSQWDLSEAYYCKNMLIGRTFQGALPKLPVRVSSTVVDPGYRGDASTLKDLAHALRVFGSKALLDNYLGDTHTAQMTHLHVERILQLRNKVFWCPLPMFKEIKATVAICESLGVQRDQWPHYILQRLSATKTHAPAVDAIAFDFE